MTVFSDRVDWRNLAFEQLVVEACRQFVKPELQPEEYARKTLELLWNGRGYVGEDGSETKERYFELPGEHCIDGKPHAIEV